MNNLFNDLDDLCDSPVIGVLAQPFLQAIKDENGKTIDYTPVEFFPHRQYIAASYIKWIELAGARVIPIPFWTSRADLETLFPKLNGLLLPGGDGAYPQQVATIIDVAVKLNESGHYFPVWATCLGLQYISTYFALRNGWVPRKSRGESTNFHFLGEYQVLNQSNRLEFTSMAKNESKWYQSMSPLLQLAYENEDLTANFHNYGISVENYNDFLQKDMVLVSTAYADTFIPKDQKDSITLLQGDELVENVQDKPDHVLHRRFHITHLEHRTLPIFGVQYHPERTLFEWGYLPSGEQYQKISRSRSAVLASQFSATFFVFECRKSPGKFRSLNELQSQLIYNFPKSRFGKGIVEIYWFDAWYNKQEDDSIVENGYHYNPPTARGIIVPVVNLPTTSSPASPASPSTPNTGNPKQPAGKGEMSLIAPPL